MRTHDFTAELWLHSDMPGAWYFVTLPLDAADEIRATNERRGFGSVRVRAAIGDTEWGTSVFPTPATGECALARTAMAFVWALVPKRGRKGRNVRGCRSLRLRSAATDETPAN